MPKINTVRHEGGSRVLAVSTIIPKEWLFVEMQVLKKSNGSITVKITKVK